MAKIYGLPEKMVIQGVREGCVIPFVASQWMDLRVGWFVSLTTKLTDDDQEGLAETLVGTDLPPADRHWIGLKSQSQTLPFEAGVPFIGFTNTDPATNSHTNTSRLVQSNHEAVDSGAGNFWRSKSATAGTFGIWEGSGKLAASTRLNHHFLKTEFPAASGNFCTLLAFRLQRSNPDSHTIQVDIPHFLDGDPTLDGEAADMRFTDDPSNDNLDVLLQTWDMGPLGNKKISLPAITMKVVPNSFFWYWPYRNSRLRIHGFGMFKNR